MEELVHQIEQYAPCLHQFIANRIPPRYRSYISAEDILQEVWSSAIVYQDQYAPVDHNSLPHWLQTIAKNKLLDALKAANSIKRGGGRTKQPLQIENSQESFIELFSIITNQYPTPSKIMAAAEIVEAIKESMAQLPQNRHQAIWMFHIEGKSREEIAQIMGKSIWAVMSLLTAGRQQLRKLLGSPNKFYSDVCSRDPINNTHKVVSSDHEPQSEAVR